MTLERFARQQASEDRAYDHTSLEDRIERVINQIIDKPHVGASLLENDAVDTDLIPLASGVENLVKHGLGKTPEGWWLVDIDTPTTVWRVTGTSADDTKYLVLGCADSCNVKLMVF